MSADLASFLRPGFKFRIFVGGEPVSRGEIEDMSMLPKPILKGGAADRLVRPVFYSLLISAQDSPKE